MKTNIKTNLLRQSMLLVAVLAIIVLALSTGVARAASPPQVAGCNLADPDRMSVELDGVTGRQEIFVHVKYICPPGGPAPSYRIEATLYRLTPGFEPPETIVGGPTEQRGIAAQNDPNFTSSTIRPCTGTTPTQYRVNWKVTIRTGTVQFLTFAELPCFISGDSGTGPVA